MVTHLAPSGTFGRLGPGRAGSPKPVDPVPGVPPEGVVLLDCATCAIRGTGCADCVVALLLGPPAPVGVDEGQVQALAVLAGCGLVPPLRHTPRRAMDVGRGA